MQIGISGSEVGERGRPSTVVERAKTAESLGFDLFSLGDSPLLRELYATLSLVADATESIRVGPMVTNPVTRHPVITACGMGTLQELSGGRMVLGLATGDSSVFMLGETPAKLRDMDEATDVIKSITRGETVENEGTELNIGWIDEHADPVPVFWAAEGPKTQHLAGKLADGVVLGRGVAPEYVDDQIARVERGAREAGRDPDEVETWVLGRANVDDDRATAIGEVASTLAGVGRRCYRGSLDEEDVPVDLRDRLRTLVENYEPLEHNTPGRNPNKDLIDDLGLTEHLAHRFGVVGTPDNCIDRLQRLEAETSLDGVFLTTPLNRSDAVIERIGEEVLPTIASR